MTYLPPNVLSSNVVFELLPRPNTVLTVMKEETMIYLEMLVDKIKDVVPKFSLNKLWEHNKDPHTSLLSAWAKSSSTSLREQAIDKARHRGSKRFLNSIFL